MILDKSLEMASDVALPDGTTAYTTAIDLGTTQVEPGEPLYVYMQMTQAAAGGTSETVTEQQATDTAITTTIDGLETQSVQTASHTEG